MEDKRLLLGLDVTISTKWSQNETYTGLGFFELSHQRYIDLILLQLSEDGRLTAVQDCKLAG